MIPPLVKGGQGRTDSDIRDSASMLSGLLLAAVGLLVILYLLEVA